MDMPEVPRDRTFQLWSYTVGHSRLLLRSTKSEQRGTRVDILFKNVANINLPTVIEDLNVERADAATTRALARSLGSADLGERQVFLVRGRNCDGYVVAGALVHREDEGEYDEASALFD